MGRLASLAAALTVAGFVAASVLAASGPAASCTAAQKSQRTAAAAAYAKGMAAARKRYYASHKSAALRKRFVAQQNAKLAALRAAASCTVPPPSTTGGQTTTTTTATGLQFSFGPGIDAGAQSVIGDDVRRAVSDEQNLIGEPINLTAYASTDASWLAQQECDSIGAPTSACYEQFAKTFTSGSAAVGGHGGIWVYWAAANFQQDPAAIVQKILAHEVFHVVQYQLGHLQDTPPDQMGASGPNWLIEGAAEFVGFRVVADWGIQDYPTSFAGEVQSARQASAPLTQFETQAGGFSYPLWEVAVDHLVSEAGGINSLVTYYRSIGAGTQWQDAFKQAFGRTVDAYYADFASYRSTL